MREGFRILDADRHVIEPLEMWTEYLSEEYHDRAPRLEVPKATETDEERIARLGARGLLPPVPVWMVDGQPVIRSFPERAHAEVTMAIYRNAPTLVEGMSPEGHLRTMERTGVDVAFLYPSLSLYFVWNDGVEPALNTALARAYNAWLRDFCERDLSRLRGVGLMSCHEPERMVELLEEIVGFGWSAVVLRPNPVRGRTLGHPDYARFWAACESLDVAVSIHEGAHSFLPTAGADRFQTHFAQHACSHPMEQMMAFLALVEAGVLERHPRLRVAFMESGCGWLPYWLCRLDGDSYQLLAGELEGRISMKPSRYFHRQCFIGFEPDEPYLGDIIEYIGKDRLLFGSDFPHLDHSPTLIEDCLAMRESIDDDVLAAMLWDNGARFYGITDDESRIATGSRDESITPA